MRKHVTIILVWLIALSLYASWQGAFDDAFFAVQEEAESTLGVGLIAHYKMNDDSASTVVTDSAGTNTGVAARNTSLLTTTGKIGGALYFNGTSDFIETALSSELEAMGSNCTVSLWLNAESYNMNEAKFFSCDDGSSYRFLLFHSNADQLFILHYGSWHPNQISSLSKTSFCNEIWTHYVFTFDVNKPESCAWINGVKQTTDYPVRVRQVDLTETLRLGRGHDNDMWYKGAMDDVRIYNRVLSTSEIAEIYNNGNGTEDQ